MFVVLLSGVSLLAGAAAASPGMISADPSGRIITVSDNQSNLVLRLNLEQGCKLDSVVVRGRQVLAPGSGVSSGIKVSNQWFTSAVTVSPPKVRVNNHTVTVSGIRYGGGGIDADETWRFAVRGDGVEWRIRRRYLSGGSLEDSGLPVWEFAAMNTWTGGMLDNGGVAWNRYLETPNATLGMHAAGVTFWNRTSDDALRISARTAKEQTALRFSHQPAGTELAVFSVTRDELRPRHDLRRFLSDRQDVWAPFTVAPGEVSITYTLQALDYARAYDRGRFAGLDGTSINELLNTIGRYGVIDRKILGGNGWRSGYVCLHEQWFSEFGLAVADPDYTANCTATYDYERRLAIEPDGRVKSRWCYGPWDAMRGTYDRNGYYEAQWGYLMDSQPAFAICVAEQFDLTGDMAWLRGQKDACERVLDYLLRRDFDHDGLLQMMNHSHTEHTASDWIDIIWAAHKNALVNAEMHCALTRWAGLESLLGDSARAEVFRNSAARLKESFNKTIAEGGFWDPDKQWYAYWRDADGSIHGDNLVIPVNFAAIAYGLCDDPARRAGLLRRIESEMQKERLFFWPLNFFPYPRDEGHANNFPYPRYENGDIFLSWGELGVRAYAQTQPAIALKYVKNVLAKYDSDGLSFQRYLRDSQNGAGDDILAGNCMTIVGLYRDIYGVQPRHNRLYLEPHLTPELNGTQLKYPLRGKTYVIDLSTEANEISSEHFALRSSAPFGIHTSKDTLEFFPGDAEQAQLKIRRSGTGAVRVQLDAWPQDPAQPRRWTQTGSAEATKVREEVSGLAPHHEYEIQVNGSPWSKARADAVGTIRFERKLTDKAEAIEVTSDK